MAPSGINSTGASDMVATLDFVDNRVKVYFMSNLMALLSKAGVVKSQAGEA